jgi:hypothetical protein
MRWEEVLAGSQLIAILAIIIGSCFGPLFYSMWKDRKNKGK